MESQLSWLDFSEQERRKMIEVIQLFKEQDTRDELGIGSIRDTLAELLFPGTGTLQTRARYFLIVPWLLTDYENRFFASSKVNNRLRRDEVRLITTLKEKETDGVIGQLSGASLHRFPSSIYWTGLRAWGILYFPGSLDQYIQSLDYYYQHDREVRLLDLDEASLDSQILNWDPNLPEKPSTFPHEADFKLSKQEAKYLKERLQFSCPDSLLTFLVQGKKSVRTARFPWFLPQVLNLPQSLKILITHAQNFSETLWGAMLLYNYLLSKHAGMDKLVEEYEAEIVEWTDLVQSRMEALKTWNIKGFWDVLQLSGRIPSSTQDFVNHWLKILFDENRGFRVIDNIQAQQLIQNREYQLKRSRSRFENPRRLELWGGRSGASQLNFRWPVASRIVDDILDGLAGDGT